MTRKKKKQSTTCNPYHCCFQSCDQREEQHNLFSTTLAGSSFLSMVLPEKLTFTYCLEEFSGQDIKQSLQQGMLQGKYCRKMTHCVHPTFVLRDGHRIKYTHAAVCIQGSSWTVCKRYLCIKHRLLKALLVQCIWYLIHTSVCTPDSPCTIYTVFLHYTYRRSNQGSSYTV